MLLQLLLAVLLLREQASVLGQCSQACIRVSSRRATAGPSVLPRHGGCGCIIRCRNIHAAGLRKRHGLHRKQGPYPMMPCMHYCRYFCTS